MKKNKKLGVALGSGGVRGLALIGALKVLEKNKIEIDYLSGCSIGAFVAAYYALEKDVKKLEETAFGNRRDIFWSFIQPSLKGGFASGKKLRQLIEKSFGDARFEDLAIPTKVVATDLIFGQQVVFGSGPIAPAVLASMSMPFFYRPVSYRGKTLIDGAISNPVPDDVVKDMGADTVVAINLHNYRLPPKFNADSLYFASLRSMHIIFEQLTHYSLSKDSILVEPPIKTSGLQSWKDFFLAKQDKDVIHAGEIAMKQALPEVRKLLK